MRRTQAGGDAALYTRRLGTPMRISDTAARPTAPPKSTRSVPHRGDISSSASHRTFQRDSSPKSRAINLKGSPMANPKLEVLTPQNSQVIFIDHQPQLAFGVQSIDRPTLKNNRRAHDQ